MSAVLERFVQANYWSSEPRFTHYNMSGLRRTSLIAPCPPANHGWWKIPTIRVRAPPGPLPQGPEHAAGLPLRLPGTRPLWAAGAIFPVFRQKLGWRYLGEILRRAAESLSDEQCRRCSSGIITACLQAGGEHSSARDGLRRRCRRNCEKIFLLVNSALGRKC